MEEHSIAQVAAADPEQPGGPALVSGAHLEGHFRSVFSQADPPRFFISLSFGQRAGLPSRRPRGARFRGEAR